MVFIGFLVALLVIFGHFGPFLRAFWGLCSILLGGLLEQILAWQEGVWLQTPPGADADAFGLLKLLLKNLQKAFLAWQKPSNLSSLVSKTSHISPLVFSSDSS